LSELNTSLTLSQTNSDSHADIHMEYLSILGKLFTNEEDVISKSTHPQ